MATRYKAAPGPPTMDALRAVHAALPLVPEDVDDCCARVVDRTDVSARDDAREWITFLRALGIAEDTDRGYRRVGTDGTDVTAAAVRDPFAERVFGAAELLAALDDAESVSVEGGFDVLRPAIPDWERERHPDWEAVWVDRTRRLLEWCATLGLATRDGDEYQPVTESTRK
jgi:hypothetical protein